MPSAHKLRRAAHLLLAAVCGAAIAAGADAPARAEPSSPCYALATTALTGPGGADLAVRITTSEGCAEPARK